MSKVVGPLFVVILSAEEKAGECGVPMGWPPAGQSPSVSDGMGVFSAEWADFGGNLEIVPGKDGFTGTRLAGDICLGHNCVDGTQWPNLRSQRRYYFSLILSFLPK